MTNCVDCNKEKKNKRNARCYSCAAKLRLVKYGHPRVGVDNRVVRNCKTCGKTFLSNLSDIKRGRAIWCSKVCRPAWNKGIKRWWSSPTEWKRGDKRISGQNQHCWKGGITPVNTKIRNSIDYTIWRTAVFTRDNYTCQKCGDRGVTLHADHIKPFSLYPELRLAIDNGRTLCVECHRKTGTYGANILYKNIN